MVTSATIANVPVPSVGRLRRRSDHTVMATAFIATMTAGQLWRVYHRRVRSAFGFSMLIVFTIGTMIAVTSTNIATPAIGRMIRAFALGDTAARSGHGFGVFCRTNAARRWVYSGWP